MSSPTLSSTVPVCRHNKIVALLLAFFAGMLLSVGIRASTVMQVDLDYLLQNAELVFEGEVVASRAQWNEDPERPTIFTHITFQVDQIIKGAHAEPTLILLFAGGQVGEVGLQIGDIKYPKVGEKGIYFVESTTKQMVNPLVGWAQGHFLLLPDPDGKDRVVTQNRVPVQQVISTGSARSATDSAAADSYAPFSKGTAQGLQLGQPAEIGSALGREAFREALRQRLEALGLTP